jgi:hypothetical protein
VERTARGQVRIPRQVTLRQDDVLRGIADVTEEPMAPIVERAAETRAAGEQLELLRHRVEAEIISGHHEGLRLRSFTGANLPAVAAAGAVDVVVEAPHQIVHHGLHIEFSEAGEDFAAEVGLAVAVSVLEIPDVRRGGDEHAPFPARNARGPREALGKHGGPVEHAVAVCVFQQTHGTDGGVGGILLVALVMRFVGVGIVAHLADVGAAVLVVGHRHWTRDERLGSEQVHAKTVEHAKSLPGIAGGRGREAGQSTGDSVGRCHHARILLGGGAQMHGSRCEQAHDDENPRRSPVASTAARKQGDPQRVHFKHG